MTREEFAAYFYPPEIIKVVLFEEIFKLKGVVTKRRLHTFKNTDADWLECRALHNAADE